LHHHAQALAPVGYAVALANESHVDVYSSCLVALFLVAAYAVDVWTSGLFGFKFLNLTSLEHTFHILTFD
jgi:hypothetical protein